MATGPNFSLAALLLGHVQTASLSNGVAFRTHTAYIAGFVQDEWKISSKLTVNYGLRWEMDTPRFEINNQQSGFDPLKINPVSGTPGVFTFAGIDGGKIHAHNFDLDNFGPRLGVAWSIGANTVIRAGYGLMIGPIYNSSSTRSAGQGFGDLRSFESPDNGVTPVFYLRDGMLPAVKEALGPAFGAVPVGGKVRQSGSFFGDLYSGDHENNEAHHFNLSIQRRVRETLVLEGAYLANLGHHVGGASDVNINVVRPQLAGATADQALRPFPQFSTLSWVGPTYGNSSYHSLNLKVEKRYSSGLNLLANYTWSKSIDDIPANPTLAGELAGQDFYNRAADKSVSGSDIRHRMVGSFVYALPIGKGKYLGMQNPVADALIGGWSLGVIMELRSGSPFGVTESSNRLNTFGPVQRSNIIGDPVLSSDRSRAELVRGWFNTQAFAFPGSGKLGNTARRLLTGPGFASADASLAKNFHFSEKRYVELRADAFNLFNRPNFRLPSGRRGQADFGTISSTFDARSIALGLRIVY